MICGWPSETIASGLHIKIQPTTSFSFQIQIMGSVHSSEIHRTEEMFFAKILFCFINILTCGNVPHESTKRRKRIDIRTGWREVDFYQVTSRKKCHLTFSPKSYLNKHRFKKKIFLYCDAAPSEKKIIFFIAVLTLNIIDCFGLTLVHRFHIMF